MIQQGGIYVSVCTQQKNQTVKVQSGFNIGAQNKTRTCTP